MSAKKVFKKKRIASKENKLHESVIGLVQVAIVFLYIVLVAFFMSIGQIVFANFNAVTAMSFMLVLVVLSVLFVALVLFGYPVWLHSEKQTRRGLRILGYSALWLLALLIVFAAVVAR